MMMLIRLVHRAQVWLHDSSIIASVLLLGCQSPTPKAPLDLEQLERRVSLEIAHVRIEGNPGHLEREHLRKAEAAQQRAEAAIANGYFDDARTSLERAELELRSKDPN